MAYIIVFVIAIPVLGVVAFVVGMTWGDFTDSYQGPSPVAPPSRSNRPRTTHKRVQK